MDTNEPLSQVTADVVVQAVHGVGQDYTEVAARMSEEG